MKTIEELKAENLPSCTGEEIFHIKEDSTPEELEKGKKFLEAINKYFDKKFLPFNTNCVRCDTVLVNPTGDGAIVDAGKHGECKCGVCGYLSRYWHQIEEFGIIQNIVLQYHPDTF